MTDLTCNWCGEGSHELTELDGLTLCHVCLDDALLLKSNAEHVTHFHALNRARMAQESRQGLQTRPRCQIERIRACLAAIATRKITPLAFWRGKK